VQYYKVQTIMYSFGLYITFGLIFLVKIMNYDHEHNEIFLKRNLDGTDSSL